MSTARASARTPSYTPVASGVLQRAYESEHAAGAVPAVVHEVLREPGEPLSAQAREFFEPRFGADFGSVRVHTGEKATQAAVAVGAKAFTVGRDIAFRDGGFAASDSSGYPLLAHELAHTRQQGQVAVADTPIALGRRNAPQERCATDAARSALLGLPTPEVGSETPILRRDDDAIDIELVPTTEEGREEAEKLGINLPTVSMETWFKIGGGPYQSSLGTTAGKQPVTVYFFPGQTNERALVIGGVHGSELSGIEVAELLVEQLKASPVKPYYTVAVVPCLFPDNRAAAEAEPEKIGTEDNVGRYTTTGTGKKPTRKKDPNRQFPTLGKPFDPKNPVDAKNVAIEPENVMLLELIDRFKPTRIASVHAYRPKPGKDASGIYADPKTDEKQKALGVEDDAKLAIRMAEKAAAGGANVPGNKLGTKTPSALYPRDEPFVEKGKRQKRSEGEKAPDLGSSLGGWGSSAVEGGRPAMTVITIEVQTAKPSLTPGEPEAKRDKNRLKELKAHAIAIEEIFLGPP